MSYMSYMYTMYRMPRARDNIFSEIVNRQYLPGSGGVTGWVDWWGEEATDLG